MIDAGDIAFFLFKEGKQRKSIQRTSDLRAAVQAGLKKEVLWNLVGEMVTPEMHADYVFRVVSKSTYGRRKLLTALEGETAARLARVLAVAVLVLGNIGDAREFLLSPHPVFDDERPMDLAYSEIGAREVEDHLMRVFYGVSA